MNTQPNKPFDFNSLSDLYEKASEARFYSKSVMN